MMYEHLSDPEIHDKWIPLGIPLLVEGFSADLLCFDSHFLSNLLPSAATT